MRISFYAPLKPPDHPMPSGDRTMGRALMAALAHAGHDVRIGSRFRSYDAGDPGRQERLCALGANLAERVVRRYSAGGWQPDLWFTYHLYHKAPDWLGPAVARRLRIPYAVAEASFAPKQAGGRWHLGHRAVAAALGQADCVFALNPRDAACVRPLLASPERLLPLPPFLDTTPFRAMDRSCARQKVASLLGGDTAGTWLMTAAMMRHDQKLQSYRLLAEALAKVTDLPWRMVVAGYGPAEAEVRHAFAGMNDRIVWAGAAGPPLLQTLYAAADLFIWPAIKEAWGMVLLEAQAAGTPVVAGRSGGVPEVVADGETGVVVPMGDAEALAGAVRGLLLDPERRRTMGEAARQRIALRHDISVAAARLDATLRRLITDGK